MARGHLHTHPSKRISQRPLPIDNDYEVESIVSVRKNRGTRGFSYLVHWKGYTSAANSWVDQEDAQNAKGAIIAFWERKNKGRTPSVNQWQGKTVVIQKQRERIQQKWSSIAHQSGAVGIEFINEIDDEELPPGIGIRFRYLERSYVLGVGVRKVRRLEGYQCTCETALQSPAAYAGVNSDIVECNEYCNCPHTCPNTVAQLPRNIPIQIFKTQERGWGARAPVNLTRGQVLGLYTGRREDANKLSGSRGSYCFDLDGNEDPADAPDEKNSQPSYSVDALAAGNWTRFVNHCCSPNLQVIPVVFDAMPQVLPRTICHITPLVAVRNIAAFEELTCDYNPAPQAEYELRRFREKWTSKRRRGRNETRCRCQADNCRGWLSVAACAGH
ncbi:hypothetical protein B0H14DRAFT_2756431 [Mycena olivaceomarginata]|nr:hypothetical protein B0H14DRAFT_2756431 [Mycena olivaceomarginata]